MSERSHADEVASGARFAFGANWQSFLSTLDESRIAEAERSLRTMLGMETLTGKSFLDIGSGSGLFSLAARRLGARVHSFDFDPRSVACTAELRRRYFEGDTTWTIEEGSILDRQLVLRLGTFDVVYSWGVLHHTGDMATAMDHAALPVNPGGHLFIALYNDQGSRSDTWRRIKRIYCSGPVGRTLMKAAFFPLFAAAQARVGWAEHRDPSWTFREYSRSRGMSIIHDWNDWLGGLPYEVASPGSVFAFYRDRGFQLVELVTRGGIGCNEYVFRRKEAPL